jgi:ABC-type transport system substrate-binding protein
MKQLLALLLATLSMLASPGAGAQTPSPERKVLRLAFTRAETSLDPARIVDLYSRNLTAHIFEAPLAFDYLARPVKLRLLTAESMPEHSPDYRVWSIKIRPGIYFADDPAFKGKKRELVAADYVYSLKRIVDPKYKSPIVAGMLEEKFIGLAALRDEAVKSNKPFDYDKPIPGIAAPDRYTLRFELEEPRPFFAESLAASDLWGAVAREVVERYGDQIDGHPVGTGPFMLKSWRRSSEIVLERNPGYRERFFEAEPAPGDAAGQAILARFKGRRIPMIDEVRVAIIEQSQPMWLSFLNAEVDALVTNAGRVPPDFLALAMPGGKLAPFLAKRGVQGIRNLNPDSGVAYFNMEDPVVGGYTPEKIALRRAISLAYDVDVEIRQIRRGGIRAQSPVVPHTFGYDPKFKSEMGDYDPARARALLDLYGYVDKDGDGWRDLPDGSPLILQMASQPDDLTRKFDELWKKNLNAIGVRIEFKPAQWPENLKAARAGKLQIWMLGSSAAGSDGQGALARLFGPQIGSQNLARFKNDDFDRLYEQMRVTPNGPDRDRMFLKAKQIAVAYMPYRNTAHRMEADMLHPWVVGFRRPLFWQDWWHMVDIDPSKRPKD